MGKFGLKVSSYTKVRSSLKIKVLKAKGSAIFFTLCIEILSKHHSVFLEYCGNSVTSLLAHRKEYLGPRCRGFVGSVLTSKIRCGGGGWGGDVLGPLDPRIRSCSSLAAGDPVWILHSAL